MRVSQFSLVSQTFCFSLFLMSFHPVFIINTVHILNLPGGPAFGFSLLFIHTPTADTTWKVPIQPHALGQEVEVFKKSRIARLRNSLFFLWAVRTLNGKPSQLTFWALLTIPYLQYFCVIFSTVFAENCNIATPEHGTILKIVYFCCYLLTSAIYFTFFRRTISRVFTV